MTTGTKADFIARLKSVLPPWFGQGATPVLDAVLSGFASVAASVYSMAEYATLQTRIMTSTDGFLDLISLDFFGRRLQRITNETDSAFRVRIQNELLRTRGTVAAISKVLTDLTGRAPHIYEPARPIVGGYGIACGYNSAGSWGSPNYPGQIFVIAYRPFISYGVPNVAGYGSPVGGYGAGAIEYVSGASQVGYADDAHIYAAVESVRPAGVTIWVSIQS